MDSTKSQTELSPPSAVRIRHDVRHGADIEFESALYDMTEAAERFPGYLGTDVLRASDSEKDYSLWQIVVRYRTAEQLEAWRSSEEAKAGRSRLEFSTRGTAQVEDMEGIEPWFSIPSRLSERGPPKWKMAVMTIGVLYPLVLLTDWLVGPVTSDWPAWSGTLLRVVILVVVLTWSVMPVATRAMRAWLFPWPA